MILDPWPWCIYVWCIYLWSLILMYVCMMHVWMMHISMIFDPDACIHDAWCMYLWSLILIHVCMMFVCMMHTFDPDSYIYDWGTLSVTEHWEQQKKDWDRGTMRFGWSWLPEKPKLQVVGRSRPLNSASAIILLGRYHSTLHHILLPSWRQKLRWQESSIICSQLQ